MFTRSQARRNSISSSDSNNQTYFGKNTPQNRTRTKRRARKSLGKTVKKTKFVIMSRENDNEPPAPRSSFDPFYGFENPTAESIRRIANLNTSPPTGTIPRTPWENSRNSLPAAPSNPQNPDSIRLNTNAQSETNQLLKLLIQKIDTGFSDLKSQVTKEKAPPSQRSPIQNNTNNIQSQPRPNENLTNNSSNNLEGESVQYLINQVNALTERLNTLTVGNSSLNNSYIYPSDKKFQAPPYKWSLKYNGDNSKLSIENFLMQVETLKNIYNYDWPQVLSNFHTFLEGDTVLWYYNYRSLNPSIQWLTFKDAMLSAFGLHESDAQILGKLSNRRQGDKETFQKFYQDLQSLRVRLGSRYKDEDMIELIRTNAKIGITQTLYTYKPTSLDDFISKCRDLDVKLHPFNYPPTSINRNFQKFSKISEVESSPENLNLYLIDSLSNLSPKICWNCDDSGHNWIDCDKERTKFCYRCGLKNFITRNCTQCANRRNFRIAHSPSESPPQ